jgi:hypothetical protein
VARLSLAAKWALNGKPEFALVAYAWRGAQQELGFFGTVKLFYRAGKEVRKWLQKQEQPSNGKGNVLPVTAPSSDQKIPLQVFVQTAARK